MVNKYRELTYDELVKLFKTKGGVDEDISEAHDLICCSTYDTKLRLVQFTNKNIFSYVSDDSVKVSETIQGQNETYFRAIKRDNDGNVIVISDVYDMEDNTLNNLKFFISIQYLPNNILFATIYRDNTLLQEYRHRSLGRIASSYQNIDETFRSTPVISKQEINYCEDTMNTLQFYKANMTFRVINQHNYNEVIRNLFNE